MISIYRKYKVVILFLGKFFVTYFLLLALYAFYLKQSQQISPYKCDFLTASVAKQSNKVLQFFQVNSTTVQDSFSLSFLLRINDENIVSVVEGCNAISVIILFLSFIIAFSSGFLRTVLYCILGSFLIYIINVVRISIITYLIYKYPEQQEFWHNLVFPSIIYGGVFLLWVIWVNKFSSLKK